MLESVHIVLHILVVVVGVGKKVVAVAEDIGRRDVAAGQEYLGGILYFKHLLGVIVQQSALLIAQIDTDAGIPFHLHRTVYAH